MADIPSSLVKFVDADGAERPAVVVNLNDDETADLYVFAGDGSGVFYQPGTPQADKASDPAKQVRATYHE